ncbi:MAG: hypothetical protein J1F61_03190 [Clostridiales bacterium]|nr:hypothetical protein [Clostridiales bacterium]
MNNDINAGLIFLNGDYLINVSIIDPIKRNTAEVLYASHECVMIKDKISGVIMLQTENIKLADRLLDNLPEGTDLVVAHNPALADLVERKLGFDKRIPCYQGVYRNSPFNLPQTDLEIRLLQENEAEAASQMYHFTIDDALRHIRLGLVYGGFDNGEMVTMIGLHYQGSMGLLEVKENCRRRGYGQIMEKFLINSLLEHGRIPYCQIIDDNAPSLALQSKLGLDISKNKLFWMRKKRPDEQEEHSCACTSK